MTPGTWKLAIGSAVASLGLLLAGPSGPQAQPSVPPGQEILVDRPGSDYRSFDLPPAGPEVCQEACRADARCRAWTWVRPGVQSANGRCWLKDAVPPPQSADCCISGVINSRGGEWGGGGRGLPPRPPSTISVAQVRAVQACAVGIISAGPAAEDVLAEAQRQARAAGQLLPDLSVEAVRAWIRDAAIMACMEKAGIADDAN